jgi:hypothetical protein
VIAAVPRLGQLSRPAEPPLAGNAPLHLTPHWLHPKSTFEDFFGGLLVISGQQFRRINGFGTQVGWGAAGGDGEGRSGGGRIPSLVEKHSACCWPRGARLAHAAPPPPQFWGWGREDDNLRERLVQAGGWRSRALR